MTLIPSPRRRGRRALTAALAGLLAAPLTALVSAPAAHAATRTDVIESAVDYANSHGYHVGIAVYDTKTGVLRGGGDSRGIFASESLIKVFIATRLLVSGRMHGSTAARAYKMITQSDDAIASSLYGSVGGDGLINWVKAHYHEPDLGYGPSRAGWWGNTHLRPVGLVRLYAKLKQDPKVRPWLLNAMHHATVYGSDGQYQFFGIPSATRHAGIKQGWGNDYERGPASADFNSTGFVNRDRYAMAILARGPISTYGSAISNLLTQVARRLMPNGIFPEGIPSVTGLSTHIGPAAGGNRVTVHGTAFTFVQSVRFGSSFGRNVEVLSPTALQVTAPQHVRANVYVRVYTPHGFSLHRAANQYLFERAPYINRLGSNTGPTAGRVTRDIFGGAFMPTTRVYFGGVAAPSVRVLSRSQLRVVLPAHAAGTVPVVVRTAYGRAPDVPAARFTFVAPPQISSVQSGAAGDTVAITGANFRAGETSVSFGDAQGTDVQVVDAGHLTVVVPAGTGTVDVTVTTPFGAATKSAAFTYTHA